MKKIIILSVFIFVISGCSLLKSNTADNPVSQNTKSDLFVKENLKSLHEVTLTERVLRPGNLKTGESLSYFGIYFDVPWTKLIDRKESDISLRLKFDNNKSVALMKDEKFPGERVRDYSGNRPETIELKERLGDNTLSSTYLFSKYIYNLTPETPNPLNFSESALKLVNLTLKNVLLKLSFGLTQADINENNKSFIIYNFEAPNIKGFQFGSVNLPRKNIQFFDNENNSYVLIMSCTQEEADFILSSINSSALK